nr:hypothetical protein CFP56_79391 [Quercus suber]
MRSSNRRRCGAQSVANAELEALKEEEKRRWYEEKLEASPMRKPKRRRCKPKRRVADAEAEASPMRKPKPRCRSPSVADASPSVVSPMRKPNRRRCKPNRRAADVEAQASPMRKLKRRRCRRRQRLSATVHRRIDEWLLFFVWVSLFLTENFSG